MSEIDLRLRVATARRILHRRSAAAGFSASSPRAFPVRTRLGQPDGVGGDASDNYRAAQESQLKAIARKAHHVFWANPEARHNWNGIQEQSIDMPSCNCYSRPHAPRCAETAMRPASTTR
jgi:hypothetical protein